MRGQLIQTFMKQV